MSKGSRDWMQFPFRWYDALLGLPDSTMRKYLEAMRDYGRDGIPPSFSDPLEVALWREFAEVINFYRKKYEAICDRNRENGKDGGRPPKNPSEPKKPSGGKQETITNNQDTRTKRESEECDAPAYPQSVEEVLEIAEKCGETCTREQAQMYFLTRDNVDWINAAGRKIQPHEVSRDLKRWLIRDKVNAGKHLSAGMGDRP